MTHFRDMKTTTSDKEKTTSTLREGVYRKIPFLLPRKGGFELDFTKLNNAILYFDRQFAILELKGSTPSSDKKKPRPHDHFR